MKYNDIWIKDFLSCRYILYLLLRSYIPIVIAEIKNPMTTNQKANFVSFRPRIPSSYVGVFIKAIPALKFIKAIAIIAMI